MCVCTCPLGPGMPPWSLDRKRGLGPSDPELLSDLLPFDLHQADLQLCELQGASPPDIWSKPLSPSGGARVSHGLEGSGNPAEGRGGEDSWAFAKVGGGTSDYYFFP